MFDWIVDGLGGLFGFVGDAIGSAIGWAWDKVVQGIYTWLANGLALLLEWVWSMLDSASTPRVTEDWFSNELAGRVGVIALAVTVAMMLASASQAALAGRPEQIGDAVKESARALVASALTVTVVDVLIGVVDEASDLVWQVGRADLVAMIEGIVVVATATGPLTSTFVGPLCLLFGFVGLIGLVVALMMRSALIYVAAAMAPVVWSVNVLPLFRGSARKLVQLTVSLIVSKLAIVITLVVAVKLIANPAGDPNTGSVLNDGAAAVGTLMTGFVCFLIAAVTPVVLYKLMPTIEGAAVSSGIAGGWMRGATTAAHTALMLKSLGATKAASAATRPVATQRGGTPPSGQAASPPGRRGDVAGFGRPQPDTSPTATAASERAQASEPAANRSASSPAGSDRSGTTRPPRRRGHSAVSDAAVGDDAGGAGRD